MQHAEAVEWRGDTSEVSETHAINKLHEDTKLQYEPERSSVLSVLSNNDSCCYDYSRPQIMQMQRVGYVLYELL